MTKESKIPGTKNNILYAFIGFFVAASVATLFTILILIVTDYFLFTRPPSVLPLEWRWRLGERIHWTFVTILWSVTFAAALLSIFGDALRRWGRKNLSGRRD